MLSVNGMPIVFDSDLDAPAVMAIDLPPWREPEIPSTPWLSRRVDILMHDAIQKHRDNMRVAEINRREEKRAHEKDPKMPK